MSSKQCHARRLRVLLSGCVVAGLASGAHAACLLNAGTFVPQDVQMDMAQVTIMPNVPVGGVIKELVVAINQRDRVAQCTGTGSAIGRYVNAAQQIPVAGFSNVYATDVAGVGIRVYRDSGSIQTFYPHDLPLNTSGAVTLIGGSFRVELVKTAAVTGSGLIAPNGRFTTYYFNGDGPLKPVLVSTFKGSGTTVVNPSCSVQAGSRNIVVEFGAVPASSFNGVGSRAPSRDFDITLDCQGSNLAQYQNRIGIRLDAAQDSSNLPGVLPVAAATDAAAGVGIELVQRVGSSEKPVQFSQNIELGTSVAGASTLQLLLRARYIQTRAGRVTPGKANGAATFTIQYN
ncbi:fimbrial protein [Stenotrophomonas terrae]|uniref:Fimbrial protein n=1 Tax=Stenotrophomonas terrae TaxID=405446 RepID=A0A0R0CI00_9GAMM|nr:fimbrial protein [Stenotrophomonas terrae]